jgi:hypothetical protein
VTFTVLLSFLKQKKEAKKVTAKPIFSVGSPKHFLPESRDLFSRDSTISCPGNALTHHEKMANTVNTHPLAAGIIPIKHQNGAYFHFVLYACFAVLSALTIVVSKFLCQLF